MVINDYEFRSFLKIIFMKIAQIKAEVSSGNLTSQSHSLSSFEGELNKQFKLHRYRNSICCETH